MGIKGLQGFVQNSCSDVCSMVNLRTLANRYKSSNPGSTPTIVVDAMCCIRRWYTPNAWVHGGQWKEYLSSLQDFIAAFTAAGIHLVFIFDGTVEQKKRTEWVKRRLQNSREIAKIFHFIKANREQPGKNMFFIPSGLSTFSRYALKLLGQEVICSKVEGDYEVAEYGLQHKCLGILGEDSDYLIFNTVPYFSIGKLHLNSLNTVMYSRENLCGALGLHLTDLPLLACLLGNDIVPENVVEGFQRKCTERYPSHSTGSNQRAVVIQAVAAFIASLSQSQHCMSEVEEMLPHCFDKTMLYRGIKSYILPEQRSPWVSTQSQYSYPVPNPTESSVCQDKDIVQIAMDEHYKGNNSMICNVLCHGETECSNTLEDDSDTKIPGQALIYKLARQHIYAILLGTGTGSQHSCPVVKEWFVYPGNQLLQPDLVEAVPLSIPGGTPSARSLWLSVDPDIQKKRFYTCLSCFHAENAADELRALKEPHAAVCCLLIYLTLQVETLSLKDVEAFLAQVLCFGRKSVAQLKSLQLPYVDSRAVHLAYLFLRGLVTLMGANSACFYPFNMMELMPWNTFDGKLFHHKYLQCHGGCSTEELLEGDESLITLFKKLRSLICDVCAAQNRILQNPEIESEPASGTTGYSVRAEQKQFNCPYQHNRRTEWRGASRQRAHYQERNSYFNSSDEHVTRDRVWRSSGTPDRQYSNFSSENRSRSRGPRTRGHQFSNRWSQQ
ncbi:constitutive coactivator of peroxisome proliferator-activated receptor gamma [Bombina bombina]|uniref:constitutive coactivator of peroxisome proliferator-activated receptor gamma n=1 Tax=Bombina bombina TaxID=8345 RepID=UPI00235A4F2F|nr:constitutive coactivator of peroxisome proliferator-activated receptor gamma [Bombina bombina]XP_053566801.1 constitutive coactivator of peroxisome proliferator-activated receptor gamma [Bombina bombina]